MKAAELRELSDTELEEKHDQFKQELFDLRFALVTGQLDNPTRLRQVRQDIARVLTVQRERELAAAQPVSREAESQ
ncbi:MAG: 50S ribosomal protein L29 [Nitriliruptorales bacterium]|nr:50S ribosomal protein L29 [Nitriliruptorales bacterium]